MVSLNTDIIASSVAAIIDPAGNVAKDPVTVWVNGVFYNPWLDIRISRSMDNAVGSFQMGFVDKWRQSRDSWPLAPDKELNIKIGSESIITGYIDKLDVDVGKDNREVSVVGRDKTADLIDCAHSGANKIKNTTFAGLAAQLLQPFGLTAVFNATPVDEPFDFEYEQGESVFDALDRYAKPRGYLLQTDSSSVLQIFNRDSIGRGIERSLTDLVQGENILTAAASYDYSDRFSTYTVKGQAPGNDILNGLPAATTKGTATDESVSRHRPHIVVSDDVLTALKAEKQAAWEADIRARQSTRVRVSVQGWRKGDGTLWSINQLVRVDAGFIGVNQDMLVSGVSYVKSLTAGTVCELELTTPQAFKADKKITTGDSPVKRPIGWKTPGAAGTIEEVAALFAKRLKK